MALPPPNDIARALILLQTVDRETGRGGLYVRATAPIDWDQAKRAGHTNVTVLRGGTHTDDGCMITIIHNAFLVEHVEADPEKPYRVRYPVKGQLVEERAFSAFLDAVEYVLQNWSPPPHTRAPWRYGCAGLYPHVVVGATMEKVSSVTGQRTGEIVTVVSRDDRTGWVMVRFDAGYSRDIPIECLAPLLPTA